MPPATSRTTTRKPKPRAADPAVERVMAEAVAADSAADSDVPAEAPTWEWAGETWTLLREPDIRAIALAQRANFNRALQMILGPAETDRLLDLDTDEPFGAAEMWDLLNSWAEPSTGATAGE